MFDIGFSELLLIAVVALVVLGPERLPKAARFAGLWVRRARNQWDSVKQELEHELHAEELKRNLQSVRASMRQAETELREDTGQLRDEAEQLREQVEQQHADLSGEINAAPAADNDGQPVDRPISLQEPAPAENETAGGAAAAKVDAPVQEPPR